MDNFRGKSPLTSQLWNESELGSHQKSVHFFTLVSFENIKVLYSARTQKIRSSRGDTTSTANNNGKKKMRRIIKHNLCLIH